MRLPNILLSVAVIIAASLANAQQFKVIKDTVDYKLMEVDSGYFYSHGIEKNKDFVADTNKFKKKDGVLSIPLLTGKVIEFKDTFLVVASESYSFYSYEGENTRLGYYFVTISLIEGSRTYLIDKLKGVLDTIETVPNYSPTYMYYVYSMNNMETDQIGITYKNLQTNKVVKFNFTDEPVRRDKQIKWINNNSFEYWISLYDPSSPIEGKEGKNKYFLVEIKK